MELGIEKISNFWTCNSVSEISEYETPYEKNKFKNLTPLEETECLDNPYFGLLVA